MTNLLMVGTMSNNSHINTAPIITLVIIDSLLQISETAKTVQ